MNSVDNILDRLNAALDGRKVNHIAVRKVKKMRKLLKKAQDLRDSTMFCVTLNEVTFANIMDGLLEELDDGC